MAMESRLTFGFAVDVVQEELFSLSPYVSGHMSHSLLMEFPSITKSSIFIKLQQNCITYYPRRYSDSGSVPADSVLRSSTT